MTETRPEFLLLDEYLLFLDELRESGDTNMYGATPYLQERFGLDKAEARQVLGYWMKTFGQEER